MKNYIFLLLCLSLIIFSKVNSFSQNFIGNLPYIQKYPTELHNYHAQNWDAVQDSSGQMLFANTHGIVIFGGNFWQLIQTPNRSPISNFDIDKNGKIFVGADAEFGYMDINSSGQYIYVSLLDQLPENTPDFSGVWKVFCSETDVIFHTREAVFIYNYNEINVIEANSHMSFYVNGKLYITNFNEGLMVLKNNKFVECVNSEFFKDKEIYSLLEINNENLLVGTNSEGLFVYNITSGDIKVFNKESNHYVVGKGLYCGLKINSETYAFGTLQNGIYFFDKNGKFLFNLNKENGLTDFSILNLYLDKNENLWATTADGINYIILNSPLSRFDETSGLKGIVETVFIIDNKILAGTTSGFFVQDETGKFIQNDDILGECWYISEVENQVLLSFFDGLYFLNENKIEAIDDNCNSWCFTYLPEQKLLISGNEYGLSVYEKVNQKWKFRNTISGFDVEARWFSISDTTIWVSDEFEGVYKIETDRNFRNALKVDFFTSENKLPGDAYNYTFEIFDINLNKKTVFATDSGVYQFNKSTNLFEKEPEIMSVLASDNYVYPVTSNSLGDVFLAKADEVFELELNENKTYTVKSQDFKKLNGVFTESIRILNDSLVFITNKDGIIFYNQNKKVSYDKPFRCLFNEIKLNDSIIYG